MKVTLILFLLLSFSLTCYSSTTIDFTLPDGTISPNEYSAQGIINITNGFANNNRLEQDNTDTPGAITITFASSQTVVSIEFFRHSTYRLENTTLTAYDNDGATGNIVDSHTLISDGQLSVQGTNNIKSIQITGVYDNYGGFNQYDNLIFSTEPLPVELTTFNASKNGNDIELVWETATEVNNYGFEIERQYQVSSSMNQGWQNIGFVEGHGNSNSPKSYTFTDESVESAGKYSYRLKQIDIDGQFEYSDVVEVNIALPSKFELLQNYPNPFNPTTSISYTIPNDGFVTLSIYDILGNEVIQLDNSNKAAGTYSKTFDAVELTSGIYFYTLRSGKYVETKKMLLMK